MSEKHEIPVPARLTGSAIIRAEWRKKDNEMNAKINNIGKPVYSAGSYARNPSNSVTVEFSDGEKVEVIIGDGVSFAAGHCYQSGQPKAEYGQMAILAAEAIL